MKALNEHQIEQCRLMRERGESWRHIGKVFGVHEMTVMTNVDPIAAEKRRAYQANWRTQHGINSRGRATGLRRELAGRPAASPEPARTRGERFTSASGVEAYSTIVTVIGGFTGVKREVVSLPYVSILGPMSRTIGGMV